MVEPLPLMARLSLSKYISGSYDGGKTMNQITKKVLALSLFFSASFLCTTQALAAEYQTKNSPQTLLYSQFAVQQVESPPTIDSFYIDFTRATNRVDLTVGAGKLLKAASPFSLEAGETVNVNFTYSPQYVSLEVGLVGQDGKFRYVRGANGALQKTIVVSETGKYYLGFRNNSTISVQVMGFVYY